MIARVAIALALATTAAAAQPTGDKVDAQSLVLSGVKLIDAHDYLGALAVFKDAYTRFPSTKILLNIGTTLKLLDRKAEAANTYQRYLDATDSDPARRAEVQHALDDLDKAVGHLDITVTPAGAEIQVNQEDWAPAAQWRVARVEPGSFTVRARKAGFEAGAKGASVIANEHVAVALALTAVPQEPVRHDGQPGDHGIVTTAPVEPLSALGVYVVAHVDVSHSGGAALVGLTLAATDYLSLRAAAILGKADGAFAGVTLSPLRGGVRPCLSVGAPVFVSSGARYGVRGAAGLEVSATRHVSVVVEVGVEHYFNPQMGIAATLFVPAVGLAGRL